MDARVNPLSQLAGKKRSFEDLSRFIGAKITGAPNYTLLMGAGCSVSSGVRSGGQLVEEWRKEWFSRYNPTGQYEPQSAKEWLAKYHAVWYNPGKEYSSLFEKNFDLPRQRRMFVEQEVGGKSPSLGYAYLIRIIEEGYLNTIFTTNFDDLVNEAFFQFSKFRPLVCAHDSSVGSITVTSKRPKVVKLHGDYLFDDIKSTVRETESLEENTRKKLIEFGRDFGLVVVGYSGCDRSVMDVLQYLLRSEEYFKHGVYWCLRPGEEPSDELLKLLWRDRVYFVEVDGFDELMASLHNDLVGDSLPVSTSVLTDKPKQIVSGFCESSFLNDSPSEVIKRDLDKLRRLGDQERLFSVIRDLKSQPPTREGDIESLSDGDLAVMMEVKRMIASQEYSSARSRLDVELAMRPSSHFKNELLDLRVTVEEVSGDVSAAIAAVDAMIQEDPREVDNYVRKSLLVIGHENRMQVLNEALQVEPYSASVWDRMADCFIEVFESGLDSSETMIAKIEECIENSLSIDPSLRNPSWETAIVFYAVSDLPKDIAKKGLDDVLERLSKMGPEKLLTMRAKMHRLAMEPEVKTSDEATDFIATLARVAAKKSATSRLAYEMLEIDVYDKFQRGTELSRRISEMDVNPEISEKQQFLFRKAAFLMKSSADLNGAIDVLKKAISIEPKKSDILRLAGLYQYGKNASEIEKLHSAYARYLSPLDRAMIKRQAFIASGNIDAALSQLRSTYQSRTVGSSERIAEVHDLLVLHRYEEASSLSQEFLVKSNWNKMSCGQLIVNHELAEHRLGKGASKKRLSELADVTKDEFVKACALYLIGSLEKSRDLLIEAVRKNREMLLEMQTWAVFSDEQGAKFLSQIHKAT